jgi:hypothetical protein
MESLVENGSFSLTLFPHEDSTLIEATFLKALTELVLKLLTSPFKGNYTLLFKIGSSRLDTAMKNAGRSDGPFTSMETVGSSTERLLLDSRVKRGARLAFYNVLHSPRAVAAVAPKVDQQLKDRSVSRISCPPPGFFDMASNRSTGETLEQL